MENKKRKIYAISKSRDYLSSDYIEAAEKSNAKLYKGTNKILKAFIKNNDKIQLDTETNVTDFYTDRELYVVQLGDIEGNVQIIIDMNDCSEKTEAILLKLFSSDMMFYAQNGKFEYIILYKHFGVYIKNFTDTMLASQLLSAGLDTPKGFNGLAGMLERTLGVVVSKEEQTTFSKDPMTPKQLIYAANDVVYLGELMRYMLPSLRRWKLMKVFNLENKTLRPLGDMTINGMLVDTEALDENIINYTARAADAKAAMIQAFQTDNSGTVQEQLREIGVIQKQDEVIINWKSSTQKKAILQYLYPDLGVTSTAKAQLIKLVKANESEDSEPLRFIEQLLSNETEHMEVVLVSRHMDFLIEQGMFIKRGTLNMNFNSPVQLLEFFRIFYPSLQSTGVKALKRLKHPVVKAYQKYTKANKLVTSFGEKMHGFIEGDGRIHGSFVQLVPSGSRVSSKRPNIQQSPSNEEFRRIYVPKPGWKLVDSDYASLELVLSAYLSQDEKMMEAINKKYDMHSFSGYQIFQERWIEAGGSKTPVGKPKSPSALKMRILAKGASFSILYGTGPSAFSEANGMTLAEGKKVLADYKKAFPQLVGFFEKSGNDSLRDLYIREPYFGRVRFFNRPKNGAESSHIRNAAMNYKPQASNGSIMKYALCIMKKYIDTNNLDDKVKIILTVHDAGMCEVKEDFAEEWAKIQTQLMEKAALYAVPDGAIKAETFILNHWTK